jgi:hypothetical protein
MFRHGHRLFSIASIGLLLVAALHVAGQFSAAAEEWTASTAFAAMQAFRFEMLYGNPLMSDFFDGLNAAFPVLLAWVGLMNLLIARYTGLRDKLMRRVCTLNLIGVGALIAFFAVNQSLIHAIALGIVEVLFFVTRFRLRRSRIQPATKH